jgi:hypothetical protein
VANQYISQMSETVRDAVFGNVGTMISFRVSADDAPILAKQFEPQFEPADLLQMHNRNFVINMVIRGEKAPAFNASTLSLPPAQNDNTGHIIENTRRNYSRSRSEVEIEIQEAIKIPENLQKPQNTNQPTQPHSIAKKWPIEYKPMIKNTASVIEQTQQVTTPVNPTPVITDTELRPKRKRTRNRKRKPFESGENSPINAHQTPTSGDDTLQINH